MAQVSQTPGALDIALVRGDDWAKLFDFDISLEGYMLEATTSAGRVITITETDLAEGKITLSMSDEVTTLLQPGETWSLRGTISGATRTFIAGRILPQ